MVTASLGDPAETAMFEIGFCERGVNLRRQPLHRRMRRGPSDFVRRTPLPVFLQLPQNGHLYGLPMSMHLPLRARDLL